MARILLVLGVVVALCALFPVVLFSQQAEKAKAPQFKYVGAAGCKPCHLPAYKIWSASPHATAFTVLATPEAKKIATAKGIADAQKSDKCLKCHVTAFDVKADLKEAKFLASDGVVCETCHGPGGGYKLVMRDLAKAKEKALVVHRTDEGKIALCTKCHNPESPTAKKFDAKTAWAKIVHPLPKKAAKS
ncbi:MAG: cytochrome c family protein [Candidatus Eisenbacteria bacterium]|nr:cytochrome c family protein [Candidatus Eisenbacteria bacterium]